MKRKIITRAIWLLSLVSLLTDLASEMLYPIMPVYLQRVGFSIALIGILEGIAEATAGLSKGYFGRLSDEWGRRLPFVRLGYALSALSKPLMAVSVVPGWVFAVRTVERLGKGLRTAPRDALLADQSNARTRGEVFGFHRSMDKLGGVLGPVAALIYLYYFPGQYTVLFLIAFVPGLLSVGLTFVLTDQAAKPSASPGRVNAAERPVSVFDFVQYWKTSPLDYRRVVGGLLAFALFNSSDVFLLLKAKEAGLSDTTVIALYIFYNLVYAVMAYPVGRLADRIGLKPTLLVGLGLFALVYEGMATASHLYLFVGLLGLYGLYAAATEGIAKAWISTICGPRQTGTAIGTYAGLSSLCALVANSVAGWLWYSFGSAVAFAVTGAATLAVIIYLVAIEGRPEPAVSLPERPTDAGSNVGLAGVAISQPDDWPTDRKPTVVMTRAAFIAMLLLIASLGVWTVYMSFTTISTANRPDPAAGSVGVAYPDPFRKITRNLGPEKPGTARTAPEKPVTAPDGWPAPVPIPVVSSATTLSVGQAVQAVTRPVRPAAQLPVKTARARPSRTDAYTLAPLYTRMYARPDKRSPTWALISIRKKIRVTPLSEKNGFFYVVYTNKKGRTSGGWLPKKDLRPVRSSAKASRRPVPVSAKTRRAKRKQSEKRQVSFRPGRSDEQTDAVWSCALARHPGRYATAKTIGSPAG